VVEEHILKRASSEQHKDEEGPSKAPMPTGLHKLRGMVRDTWRFCNWTATQLFELREDMNRLLKHQGLSFNAMLPPPPIFPDFPEYTTSEDEGEKDPVSPMAGDDVPAAQSEEEEEEDIEPLSAKMARLRKEAAGKRAMGSSSAGRTRRKTTARRPVKSLWTYLLDLALTLDLTALSLRLRRMPLIPVMNSDSLGPILISSLLFFPFC
jgi:hypothetical protein